MKRVKISESRKLKSLLDLAGKTTEDEFLIIIKKLGFDAFSDLVNLTPYDTGFARGGWRVGINGADETVLHNTGSGVTSAPVFGNPSIKFGDIIHEYNNVAYIKYLDAGWSKQAPAGMIEPTFSRIIVMADRLSTALSKKRMTDV